MTYVLVVVRLDVLNESHWHHVANVKLYDIITTTLSLLNLTYRIIK